MANNVESFGRGDWVVHRRYGVGEILGLETKQIGGPENDYYKIRTHNSTIWVPVEKIDSDWFRPLASPTEFQRALEILRRPARQMHSNYKSRKQRIEKVTSDNSLVAIARLVRDLWARQESKRLTNTEQIALRRFTKRFVAEWSVCMGVELGQARQQLYRLLRDTQREQQPVMQ